MKVTLNLSPSEIFKLGKLTNSSFKDGWNTLSHTVDSVAFAIHHLIEISQAIDCDGDCDNCPYADDCCDDDDFDDNTEGILH